MKSVVLYTSPGCPDCRALKTWLAQRDVDYTERSLAEPGVAEEAKQRYGVRIAPIIAAGDRFLYGTFEALLPGLTDLLGPT